MAVSNANLLKSINSSVSKSKNTLSNKLLDSISSQDSDSNESTSLANFKKQLSVTSINYP